MEQLHINCTNCTMTAGQPKQPHQDTATMDGQSTIEFYWRFSSTAQIMGGK
jgi:hypothetical protein